MRKQYRPGTVTESPGNMAYANEPPASSTPGAKACIDAAGFPPRRSFRGGARLVLQSSFINERYAHTPLRSRPPLALARCFNLLDLKVTTTGTASCRRAGIRLGGAMANSISKDLSSSSFVPVSGRFSGDDVDTSADSGSIRASRSDLRRGGDILESCLRFRGVLGIQNHLRKKRPSILVGLLRV
jgi:hypothetical protein